MTYYQKLFEESLEGKKASLKELQNIAASGDADAQFLLARYCALSKAADNGEYQYWLHKSADNGNKAAIEILKDEIMEKQRLKKEMKESLMDDAIEFTICSFFRSII